MCVKFLTPPSVEWLEPKHEAEWDGFVRRHRFGLVYHLSAWQRVLQTSFPHIRGRFLVLRHPKTGAIEAGLPIYAIKSWLLGRRLSSLPFASFCDPLITSVEQFRCFLPELEAWRRRTRSCAVEIRANKTIDHLTNAGLSATSTYKHHYLSLDRDLSKIFAGFAKSSVRQKILQAERAAVRVEEQGGEEGLKICHNILAITRSRRSLPVLPFAFFKAMGEHLRPHHLRVFLAYQGQEAVACHLILRFKDLWISEYSGNTDNALNGVNQLLYWETIKRAHADGAKTFSFGRTSITNEGLLSYKRRWDPVEEDLGDFRLGDPGTTQRKDEPRENSLAYRFARTFLSTAPRGLSSRVGNYLYRHLG
jgi:hypothetical protein